MGFASVGLQVVLHLVLVFWFFFLVWKTFPFRFGMLKKLIVHEFPVLFWVPFSFALFLAERGYRVAMMLNQTSNVITIYEDPVYLTLFYTRQIFSLFFMAACMKSAIQVASPTYYKP